MKLGSNDIGSVYLGTNAVQKIYLGTNEVWSSYAYLLDDYSGAEAAYSLRLLSSTYTGDAIQVRRASDNTTQDIGFVNNELDTTSLASFCSGTDGFVTTWYDQSGNANHATQTTASNQPQIVSNGSVITKNGKASITFTNTSALTFNTINVTNQAIFQVIDNQNTITTSTSIKFLISGTRGGVTFGSSTGNVANERIYWFNALTGKAVAQNTSDISSGQHILSLLYNTSDFASLFMDNVEYTLTNSNIGGFDATNYPTQYNTIGRATLSFNDNVQELIFYPSDQSSNQSDIETNINDFYSIY